MTEAFTNHICKCSRKGVRGHWALFQYIELCKLGEHPIWQCHKLNQLFMFMMMIIVDVYPLSLSPMIIIYDNDSDNDNCFMIMIMMIIIMIMVSIFENHLEILPDFVPYPLGEFDRRPPPPSSLPPGTTALRAIPSLILAGGFPKWVKSSGHLTLW